MFASVIVVASSVVSGVASAMVVVTSVVSVVSAVVVDTAIEIQLTISCLLKNCITI